MPTDANNATIMTLVVLLGLACGSFLNVLASRTLKNESLFWPPSHCTSCNQNIKWYDNIPLVSYFLLKGQCRACQAKISWQYPLVEAITAALFFLIYQKFGWTIQTLGMLVFACTLVAVTVTDFREKLIPHDITYPSMLLGIAYSYFVRSDLLGCLAGIGVSYILFDFIAHYGLKFYLKFHAPEKSDAEEAETSEEEEVIEVMGGGDAVLSAVIASWLGWQKLVLALIIGFLLGTIMGLFYLVREMQKEGIISQCVRPVLTGSVIGIAFVVLLVMSFRTITGVTIDTPWLSFASVGALAGALLGFISVGTKVSKPFPFGPALAAGALAAIFANSCGVGGIFPFCDR